MPTLDEDNPEASNATANISAAPPPTSSPSPAWAASIESMPVCPAPLNSDAAMHSIDRFTSPAAPSPISTSIFWKRSISLRSPSSRHCTLALVSAECR